MFPTSSIDEIPSPKEKATIMTPESDPDVPYDPRILQVTEPP